MAFSFNGSNQNLRVGSGIIAGYPFTLSCWFSCASASSNATLFSICGSAADPPYYALLFNTNRNVYSTCSPGAYGPSGSTITSSAQVALNTWSFAACTVTSGGGAQAVYSGSTKNSTTPISFIGTDVNRTSIGVLDRGTPVLFFNGQIAEPAIWNVALTDAEIASLAAGYTPDQICPQSLQFYAPLVRDLVDVRGGRAITNVNSATVANHPRIIT